MSTFTDDVLQQLIDFVYKKDTREKVNLYFLDPAAKYVTNYAERNLKKSWLSSNQTFPHLL